MAGGAWCHHVEKPEWRGKIPCVPPSSVQVTSHTITPVRCAQLRASGMTASPSLIPKTPSPASDLPSPQVINNTSLCNTTHIDKTPTKQAAIDTERKQKQHANATGGMGYQSDAKGIRISRCRKETKKNHAEQRNTLDGTLLRPSHSQRSEAVIAAAANPSGTGSPDCPP